MSETDPVTAGSTTEGLPISPSFSPSLALAKLPTHRTTVDGRLIYICALSTIVGLIAGLTAQALIRLIRLIWNFSFYLHISLQPISLLDRHAGWLIVIPPIVGALVVGLMARFGSAAVAGHGIPEAMEQVLTNQSKIPARLTFLKPLAAAVSIGTGGPFGVEGPIIATGGALGSLLGQVLPTSATERKILLAAGAAAGIAAAFGSPIAAVLLAIELLLFEFRARSILPVSLASAVAVAVHVHFEGAEPPFAFTGPAVPQAGAMALIIYTAMGVLLGLAAIGLTWSVHAIEEWFEHVPVKWYLRPAIGAVMVGIIGFALPRTLGPGYGNITQMLSAPGGVPYLGFSAIAALAVLKFLAWTISLGSGTSGGTLAPVFTIGGAVAALLAIALLRAFPDMPIDVRVAALMGMVAIFAGASRAFLTSVVFAYETTHEPAAVLPALCGCVSAYLISALLMKHSIMTHKMNQAGVRVPADYHADFLESLSVGEVASKNPVCLEGNWTVAYAREWLASPGRERSHQGYPIVDDQGVLLGILTRRNLTNPTCAAEAKLKDLIGRPPVVVYADCTLRDAADHMVNHDIGRLPVIERGKIARPVGMITRSDLLAANRRRLAEENEVAMTFSRIKPEALEKDA